jgi:succinate dehydrogenase hydrophobic anchor subunit
MVLVLLFVIIIVEIHSVIGLRVVQIDDVIEVGLQQQHHQVVFELSEIELQLVE